MLEGENNFTESERKVLSALSREGSLTILKEANSKLTSKRGTHAELGLTKRQYYSRLRELKKLDVIKKEGEGYVRTEKGDRLYQLAKKIMVSMDDSNKEDVSFINVEGKKVRSDIITEHRKSIKKIKGLIENAEEEILIASRYIDHPVLNTIVERSDEIEIKGITRKLTISDSFELSRAIFPLNRLKKLIEFTKKKGRVVPNLPFSFGVQDKRVSFLEVLDPLHPNDFFFAIVLENEKLSEELRELFYELYDMAEKPEIPYNQIDPHILDVVPDGQ